MLLPLCIVGFIIGGLALIIFIITLIGALAEDCIGDTPYLIVLCVFAGIAVVGLVVGSYNCAVGNKEYDKITRIYSLQPSERFVLGASRGYYYYDLNDTNDTSRIDKLSSDETTLIQTNDIEYPYILEHKVKWEEKEYFIYVPEDVKIIQYSIVK